MRGGPHHPPKPVSPHLTSVAGATYTQLLICLELARAMRNFDDGRSTVGMGRSER
jgi:hypothetical protein